MSLQDAIKDTVKDMIENNEIEIKVEDGEIVLSVADQSDDDDDSEEQSIRGGESSDSLFSGVTLIICE